MKIKLFVSDIDGTLLLPGQKVTAKNIAAVNKMVSTGITVTIATGRMYRAALPIALELGVNVPIITYNGALIKSVDGEIIHAQYLPENLVTEITKFYQRRGWYLQNYSEDNLYYAEHNKYAEYYETTQKVQGTATGWDELKSKTFHTCKLLSIADNEEQNLRRMAEL